MPIEAVSAAKVHALHFITVSPVRCLELHGHLANMMRLFCVHKKKQ